METYSVGKKIGALFASSKPDVAIIEAIQDIRPPVKSSRLERRPVDPKRADYIAEYSELAATVGIMPPDLGIESFKTFLFEHDLPIFSLAEVIAYMDTKAEKESKHQAGWEWRPLRSDDAKLLHSKNFGIAAEWKNDEYGRRSNNMVLKPASDYFRGGITQQYQAQAGQLVNYESDASSKPYDRTIPLHALRRIALIEKEHKSPVAFFVSDYALAPAIPHPDPFLMAVVPNLNLANGEGRFVIDFWDEPGFGIDKMVK